MSYVVVRSLQGRIGNLMYLGYTSNRITIVDDFLSLIIFGPIEAGNKCLVIGTVKVTALWRLLSDTNIICPLLTRSILLVTGNLLYNTTIKITKIYQIELVISEAITRGC